MPGCGKELLEMFMPLERLMTSNCVNSRAMRSPKRCHTRVETHQSTCQLGTVRVPACGTALQAFQRKT